MYGGVRGHADLLLNYYHFLHAHIPPQISSILLAAAPIASSRSIRAHLSSGMRRQHPPGPGTAASLGRELSPHCKSPVIQSLPQTGSSDSAQERTFGSLEDPAFLSHRSDLKDPTGRTVTASQAISSKGVNCSGARQNGFSFFPPPKPHFSYFRISFSFSWLFSVH